MWIADKWDDYEVIDCTSGEKLERWGDYILLRPDPQVIWDTKKSAPEWKHLNAHYHRSSRGGGQWEFFDLPEEWEISYTLPTDYELTFRLKPFSFKHTGIFPEQAANWSWFSQIIADECDRRASSVGVQVPDTASQGSGPGGESAAPIKVLNLFAYTGGATLAAASAGAHVTHVDASKGMVSWAKENAACSGLSDAPIRWLVDDCKKFVEREIRRGNRYDAVIMDPPSYGRGPKGEIWKIEDSVYELITLASQILCDEPLFFLVNSYTTGLQPAVLHYMISTVLRDYGGTVWADEIGLPVRESGLYLPCGASGRWSR